MTGLSIKLKIGYNIDSLIPGNENKNLVFPIMWIYGRRDYTISIMGANIYPEDIEQCLYADKELAKITRSFVSRYLKVKRSSKACFLFRNYTSTYR
jgi:phenylacetate-coenzyme A ligase PaaK-like adenylate-forming protein